MNRRELIKMITLITGTAVVGADFFLSGCTTEKAEDAKGLSSEDISFLDEVGETILPRTSTPGAKDAHVGAFMAVIVADCYTQQDQDVFHEGIKQLNAASRQKFGKGFVEVSPENRTELLLEIEKEAKTFQESVNTFNDEQNKKEREAFDRGELNFVKEKKSSHYYIMMKQLTLWGFFTSEVGSTQALRHVAVPGRWEACIPYKKGDRAWG